MKIIFLVTVFVIGFLLIKRLRKEEDMNTQALTDAVTKLTAAVDALPAALAAQNTVSQAAIDAAATAVADAATKISALAPAPVV